MPESPRWFPGPGPLGTGGASGLVSLIEVDEATAESLSSSEVALTAPASVDTTAVRKMARRAVATPASAGPPRFPAPRRLPGHRGQAQGSGDRGSERARLPGRPSGPDLASALGRSARRLRAPRALPALPVLRSWPHVSGPSPAATSVGGV